MQSDLSSSHITKYQSDKTKNLTLIQSPQLKNTTNSRLNYYVCVHSGLHTAGSIFS